MVLPKPNNDSGVCICGAALTGGLRVGDVVCANHTGTCGRCRLTSRSPVSGQVVVCRGSRCIVSEWGLRARKASCIVNGAAAEHQQPAGPAVLQT
jgi:hypothetical protein